MDCLELVRLLTAHQVNIFFEKENLGTQESGGELILSILASIAEEESRSISENEKWSIQKRFQKGTFRLSRPPYGYDLVNGQIMINQEEAAIVRYIFNNILSGRGTSTIAAKLNEQHIPTKRGGSWHTGTIQAMIHNVFFAGDLLMQKTWRDSQYRVQFNYGEYDQYYIEDHHPAIVSREVFTAANLACAQRGREKNNLPVEEKHQRNDPHHNRYCFTGKIFCSKCGNTLKRQMIYRSDGSHAIWVCRTHLNAPKTCPLKRIHEEDIMHAFVTMLNKLAFSRKYLLQPYIDSLISPVPKQANPNSLHAPASYDASADPNTNEQKRLIMYYSKGRLEPVVFYKRMAQLKKGTMTYAGEISEKTQDSSIHTDTKQKELIAEAKDLNSFLSNWQIGCHAFNEEVFTRFTDQIIIDSRSQITFCLKCGLALSEKIG